MVDPFVSLFDSALSTFSGLSEFSALVDLSGLSNLSDFSPLSGFSILSVLAAGRVKMGRRGKRESGELPLPLE